MSGTVPHNRESRFLHFADLKHVLWLSFKSLQKALWAFNERNKISNLGIAKRYRQTLYLAVLYIIHERGHFKLRTSGSPVLTVLSDQGHIYIIS